ncbi:UPF0722 protein C11orf88-like [Silurus asotus]|uniref:Cilia- and flagella-associated protein HOATZ n=1 Tax=Silurus asotus TaxID=30991 RepID=A0AAD5A1U8_SILAS|nr:UPF0722 protein C11orf88-like [Silurus asotus]
MREEGDVEHSVETLSGGGVCYTVFEGSSEEDVAHSKVFWSSIYLQPPIESSLETVDIGQRLRRAKAPQRTLCNNVPKQPQWTKNDEILQRAYQLQMQDEKQRYLEMGANRVNAIPEAATSSLYFCHDGCICGASGACRSPLSVAANRIRGPVVLRRPGKL